MTDYRTRLFEQAAVIAEDRENTADEAYAAAPEHLKFAALKLLEGWSTDVEDVLPAGKLKIAYGEDVSQHEDWGDHLDWWDGREPAKNGHRFRLIMQDDLGLPKPALGVMAELDGKLVYVEDDPNKDVAPFEGGTAAYHFIVKDTEHALESSYITRYREWLEQEYRDGNFRPEGEVDV